MKTLSPIRASLRLFCKEIPVELTALRLAGEKNLGINDALMTAELVLLLYHHLTSRNLLRNTLTAVLLHPLYRHWHEQSTINIVLLDTKREAVEEEYPLSTIEFTHTIFD